MSSSTVCADILVAARQAKRVKGESVADGASELDGNVGVRDGSVPVMSKMNDPRAKVLTLPAP